MSKAVFLLIIIVSIVQNLQAQTIIVLDKKNNEAIENVLIYDEIGNQSLTSTKGEF